MGDRGELFRPVSPQFAPCIVSAIVNLVASSIPNMTTDSVTVADSNGNVLNAPGMDLSSSRGLQQQIAAQFERQLACKTRLANPNGAFDDDVTKLA